MPTEKTITRETKTETKYPPPVKETKTTTTIETRRVEPEPRVIEETVVEEDEED